MSFDNVPPISLLAGSQLIELTALEYNWVFRFSCGVTVIAEGHWRLVLGDRVILTDEDDGHLFGLEQPIDAAAVVQTEVSDSELSRAGFSPVSDLLLRFANGRELQVLVGSSGYENWHVYGADNSHTYAVGGGELFREAS